MIERTDPTGGEELASPKSRTRILAYDLTFSAPKSVSVLYAIADERTSRALRDAHDEAVSDRARLPRARGLLRAPGPHGRAPARRHSPPGRGLRLGRLPPSDEPRPGPPASHPRRHREPRPLRRPLVGARRLRALQARQGGRLPLRGAPPTRGARATAVGPLLGGREGDRRHRGRARGRAAGVQPSPRRDPGVARARGPKRTPVRREGGACDPRAEGRRDRHCELARCDPRPGGRARARSRRARGAHRRHQRRAARSRRREPRLATCRGTRDDREAKHLRDPRCSGRVGGRPPRRSHRRADRGSRRGVSAAPGGRPASPRRRAGLHDRRTSRLRAGDRRSGRHPAQPARRRD